MGCNVVCLSHTTGSGGDEIGKMVAEQLGYLYVDEDIVARAAAQGGLEPGEVADEERRKSPRPRDARRGWRGRMDAGRDSRHGVRTTRRRPSVDP
jgi:hypothetical protein